MPNIMIHEEVGYYISKKININSYNYYLGILAPDSPNLEGFAPKVERWTAHARRKDYNEWRNSLKDLYNNYKDKIDNDFLIGYYIHILTDIVFDDYFYLDIREKILQDGYKLEESHQVMLDDYNKYYFNEIEGIKEILNSSNESFNINNINKELLIKWKNKSINNLSKNNTSKYITNEVINNLNEKVYKELTNLIS